MTAGIVAGTQICSFAENADILQEAKTTVMSTALSLSPVQVGDAQTQNDGVVYTGVADIAEQNLPAIVAITNKSVQEVQSYFRGRSFQYESESCGSGIIVGESETELLICTNNHVVENASELTVSFIDETSYTALVKGTDPDNDLAIVAVDLEEIGQDTRDAIRVAQTGSSEELRIGEQVVAIGNALGYGQSVTTGIVSALDRSIECSDEYGYGVSEYDGLIQTDAAINPGNSGGALLNMKGELIGINSAKASANGVEGMGYAIPIAKAQPILEDLMNRVTRTKADESEAAYLGISGQDVTRDVVKMYGVPEGIYVVEVPSGGPADQAGLQPGDIITGFDGTDVTSMNELIDLLQYYKSGETVELEIATAAGGAYTDATLSVTLGSVRDRM